MTGSGAFKVQLRNILRRLFAGAGQIASGPAAGLRFDAGADQRFRSGEYERPVQDRITGLVRGGDVCYDVGANLGFFSVLLARLAGPTGAVYAFEPVPQNAALIERNARLNQLQTIKVRNVAVSNRDGSSDLLLARHVGGAMLEEAGTPPDLAGRLTVRTATLDKLVEDREIPPPSFVKIDVEGAELSVLRGMQRILRESRPTVLLELDDSTEQGCEQKVTDCQALLLELGYRVEPIPGAYADGRWFVRHFVAQAPCS
jgi:FkbM family methyltransferase